MTKFPGVGTAEKGGFILGHSLRGFGPWPAGSIAFRPVRQQNIGAERRAWQGRDGCSIGYLSHCCDKELSEREL